MSNAYAVRRTLHGDLEITTAEPLGADRRELRITTRRNSGRRTLQARAAVVQVSEDGRSYTHAFSLSRQGCGDFSAVLIEAPGRATEKALTALHLQALQQLPEVLTRARAWYAPAATTPTAATA